MNTKYLYLAAGVAIGSVVTFLITKNHYQAKMEQEINDIREYYGKKAAEELKEEQEMPKKYQDLVVSQGYSPAPSEIETVFNNPEDENRKDFEKDQRFLVITEDEYGNNEEYDAIPTYVYYANGVLTDETGEPMSAQQICNTVGAGFASLFSYDVLYIRNNELKADFEIVLDESDYVEPTIRG